MTTETEAPRPAWMQPNGKPKPEYRLKLRRALPDGTTHLDLAEPTAKVRRKAMSRVTSQEPTPGEALELAEILVAGVTGLDLDNIGEMYASELDEAGAYLLAFFQTV